MQNQYLITIRAENRPGLLHLITGVINRKLIPIESLNAGVVGSANIALIAIEINVANTEIKSLILRLTNIIEVYTVDAILKSDALLLTSAFYIIDKQMLASPLAETLKKCKVEMLSLGEQQILVSHQGRAADVDKLFQKLSGRYLLGAFRSAPI